MTTIAMTTILKPKPNISNTSQPPTSYTNINRWGGGGGLLHEQNIVHAHFTCSLIIFDTTIEMNVMPTSHSKALF